MRRVELIVGIDEDKDPDSIQKLASGQDLPVSMSCTVPYDICTICGNEASKPSKYCTHIKEAVTQFTDDGRQIGMINTEPTFFDISKVHKNADRIAFSLRKVAGVGPDIVLSAELAEHLGISEPAFLTKNSKMQTSLSLLKKLAKMEKEIEGEIKGDDNLQNIAASMQDLPEICTVQENQLKGVLAELSDARVSLPIEDFFKLVMGDRYSEIEQDIPSACTALPGVFSAALDNPEEFLSGVENYQPVDSPVPNVIRRVIENLGRTSSLSAGPLGGKIQITVLRKNASTKSKAPVTDAGRYLANEYAKYKFAFVERVKDPFITKMALLQNFR
jgi:hypothetical protein